MFIQFIKSYPPKICFVLKQKLLFYTVKSQFKMGFNTSLTVLTVLFLVAFHQASSQVAPRITLYDRTNQGGMSLTLTDYSFNLGTQYGYNDRARSFCMLGIWIFYDNTSFGRDGGGVAYSYNPNSALHCTNMLSSVSGKVTSVRYGGHVSGYGVSSFTLFESDWFRGVAEEKFYADKPSLNFAGRHKSIIITGSSQWTVYEGYSYSGPNKCLHSTSLKATIIPNIADIGIKHHSLRSVRKGCWSKAEDIIILSDTPLSGSNGFLNSTLTF